MSTEKFVSIMMGSYGRTGGVWWLGVYLASRMTTTSHDSRQRHEDVHAEGTMKNALVTGRWDPRCCTTTRTNQRLDEMKKELEQQHDLLA